MGKQQQQQPPPLPPAEFPEPFAPPISARPSDSAYRRPGPQPGNNPPQRSEFLYISSSVPCILRSIEPRGFLVPSPSAYYTQPNTSYQPPEPLPPPVRQSTHPRTSQPPPPVRHSTHPVPAPTRQPAPIYENASRTPPSPPQSLSRSSSHNPTFPIPLRQESHASTDSSGSLSPMTQRQTSIPIPNNPRTGPSVPHYDPSPPDSMYPLPNVIQRSTSNHIPGNPNTATAMPYYDSSPPNDAPPMRYYDSSPPSSAFLPSRSEISAEPLPMERSWSYRTCPSVYLTRFSRVLHNDRQSMYTNERMYQVTTKNSKAQDVRMTRVVTGRRWDHQVAPTLGDNVNV